MVKKRGNNAAEGWTSQSKETNMALLRVFVAKVGACIRATNATSAEKRRCAFDRGQGRAVVEPHRVRVNCVQEWSM